MQIQQSQSSAACGQPLAHDQDKDTDRANVLVFPDAECADLAYNLLSTLGPTFGSIRKGTSRVVLVARGTDLEEVERGEVVVVGEADENLSPPVDLEMADAAAWDFGDEAATSDAEELQQSESAVPV